MSRNRGIGRIGHGKSLAVTRLSRTLPGNLFMNQYIELLLFLVVVVVGTTCFLVFWFYWMRMCVRRWIHHWADIEAVTLHSHKLQFFNRGPFPWSITSLTFPLYFRVKCSVKCSDKNGVTKTGWVKLGNWFFVGGKGCVIWDAVGDTDEKVN